MHSLHDSFRDYAVCVPAELAVPLVETAFNRECHTEWLHLREHSLVWMLERRLMSADIARNHADSLRYTDLIASYYVGAPTEALQAIADFSIWFFAWDDIQGCYAQDRRDREWRRLSRGLHRALEAPSRYLHDADPLVAGLADCLDRFYTQLGSPWSQRFAGHFHAVIEGYDREYDQRVAGQVLTEEEYIALRGLTFGYGIWLDCLELAAGRQLPPDILDWSEYRRAGLASQEFAGFYNDLCSLPKELAAGEVHNLGICLIRHHGLSLEQAIAETRRRTEIRASDFLSAEQDVLHRLMEAGLPADIDQAVRHCLFNMRNWISATYWFHHESGRYRVADWQNRSRPPYVGEMWSN